MTQQKRKFLLNDMLKEMTFSLTQPEQEQPGASRRLGPSLAIQPLMVT